MKKTLSICMVLFLVLSILSGCQAPSQSSDTQDVADNKPATNYPEQPVKIIVVRKAGGSADVVARMYAPFLQKHLGVNVVVENIDGGAGTIGLSQAFRAKPDGYTLVLGNFPSYILQQEIEGGVDYVMREFTSIVGITGNEANVLIVPGNSEFDTIEDLVEFDKVNPGKLNIGITSGLSNSSLAQAMFISQTNLSAEPIPFDSGNAVVSAVMGGHVDLGICSAVASYQPAKDGNIKVLATFGTDVDGNLPGVPTFASIYGKEYAYDVSMGILAPPNLPGDIFNILSDAAYKAVTDPEFAETVGDAFNVVPRTAAELAEIIELNYKITEENRELLQNMQ
jgi:tripartite-type tricarboxylate transporter receptor subunit TctC